MYVDWYLPVHGEIGKMVVTMQIITSRVYAVDTEVET